MADGINFAAEISCYIGETVTIFTTSGGVSGQGFTGVVLSVNACFVRLITQIGPAPGCALGNACTGFSGGLFGGVPAVGAKVDYRLINTVGSVADIPIDKIASFVHNAV
jgi:hypothetical protein